ncbi:uncharacterized protein Z519_00432 [Cladophialophora bantiana CBS 173.52]|uniref:Uncharacterized protein n=1 Tax=Cladophialophora bantiana (strain ATCC 10958 / CBS 173.52 / CDC B-1940 / NIH 8579) TaxID=1442370 RepID=A0A0D2IPN6_CLAB1|nr:uncharacterized protein Z519_00432 [Cladophialophora bantiana CBS 173.52]KIW98769.1 hypothetical protein Z519_00432 [Cladophialophora bantiana CBS 173.52]
MHFTPPLLLLLAGAGSIAHPISANSAYAAMNGSIITRPKDVRMINTGVFPGINDDMSGVWPKLARYEIKANQ